MTFTARLLLAVAVIATIGCDRVTKRLATESLAGRPDRTYLAGTIRLAYVENTGGFLSVGARLPPAVRTGIFTVGTGVMMMALLVGAVWSRRRGWLFAGVVLFMAGGVSNWIDRVNHGAVVDFMNVGVGSVRTGIFNVADVAIMAGAAVVLVAGFQRQRRAIAQLDR